MGGATTYKSIRGQSCGNGGGGEVREWEGVLNHFPDLVRFIKKTGLGKGIYVFGWKKYHSFEGNIIDMLKIVETVLQGFDFKCNLFLFGEGIKSFPSPWR